MSGNIRPEILFVINAGAGPDEISWQEIISNFFTEKELQIEYYILNKSPDFIALKDHIKNCKAKKVVAVGGDGTVTMVAKLIAETDKALGILPAGSANGMAKELNIPEDIEAALSIIENGIISPCDAIKINGKEICLHLSDIGMNAQLIKYFDEGKLRGKWGYARVILKTLLRSKKMQLSISSKGKEIVTQAFMVVLANASKYGTGAVINPEGVIDDGEFEVVVVRKLSFKELLKMLYKPGKFDSDKIEIFHATAIKIRTRKKVHFQIDGEYMGKVNAIEADILRHYIDVILPAKDKC